MRKFTVDETRIGQLGTRAWRRIKKEVDKSFGDWITVGETLVAGRQWAMTEAGTNRPMGATYNDLMAEWLERFQLGDMDKGDRSRLVELMDNIGPIEEWRASLPINVRGKYVHPSSVLRKWKAATQPKEPRQPRMSAADVAEVNAIDAAEGERLVAEYEEKIAALEQELKIAYHEIAILKEENNRVEGEAKDLEAKLRKAKAEVKA